MDYRHGGDSYRNKIRYDFSISVNPLGMPVECVRAAQAAVEDCERYPDWRADRLCEALSRAEGVRPEQVLVGNGAAELLFALCGAMRGVDAVMCAPSFHEYERAVAASGGRPVWLYLKEEAGYRPSVGEILAACGEGTGLLFINQPANPTGTLLSRQELEEIADFCEKRGIRFCLDECFLPFLTDEEALTMKHELERYPHLIVLRAFTKIYAMPGLRLGYALCADTAFLERMRSCLQPWNTSIPAQEAGLAALALPDWLERTRAVLAREREYLLHALEGGLAEKVYDGRANYLFFKGRPDLGERLLQEGILIRSCADYRGLTEGYYRIGVRSHEENQELLRVWRGL